MGEIKVEKNQSRVDAILRRLLLNRGLRTKKQQEEFLKPKDPYRLTLEEVGLSSRSLNRAVIRLQKAIDKKEKIVVYGDYDTDGICAAAIMWETLYKLGADVSPFIPHRKEGYGLKNKRLRQMAQDGVGLVVTVDQGIVQLKEVSYARRLGLEVIVTDHHLAGKKKPRAAAVVHTTALAGSGVAWFLAKKLWTKQKQARKLGLDLVTIGTVVDMMPLLGPNRSLVKFGLKDLAKTKRPGLLALYRLAGIDLKNLGAGEVGFVIGPRLNASGRMADPLDSLRLVCTKDKNRGWNLAEKIDLNNRQRQKLTRQMVDHARELWRREFEGKEKAPALIFVSDESYQQGVVGLVAHQLMDEFYRPAIVLAPGQDWWVASARSIEEFDMIEAIRSCADLLGPHGGHRLAAGFSVESVKMVELKERLIRLAEEKLGRRKLEPTLRIETELSLTDLNFKLIDCLERLAPFGLQNPRPIFATRGVTVIGAQTMGAANQHLKLRLLEKSTAGRPTVMEAVGFRMGDLYSKFSDNQPIDIAYSLLINRWRGQKKLQLKLKSIKFKDEAAV